MVNKRVRNAVLGCNLKNDRMISSFPRQTIQYHSNPSLFPQPVMLKKLKLNSSMKIYKTFQKNTPKRYPFHYRGLECKSKNSRDIWSNRQIWSWSTKRSRSKANRVLPRECTGHRKHHLPITQEKTTHEHQRMANTEIRLIIFFAVEDGEALYSQQKQGM